MVSSQRTQRIADRIREEISELLIFEIQDPRLVGISITDVTVDRELVIAHIYVSALEGSERADEVLEGLIHARGYIRHVLAERINLRTFPQLRFHWDPTYEKAEKIDRLIKSLQEDNGINLEEENLDTD